MIGDELVVSFNELYHQFPIDMFSVAYESTSAALANLGTKNAQNLRYTKFCANQQKIPTIYKQDEHLLNQ